MKFLTFDKIKAHLRLDDTQAELEQGIIEDYGAAAEDAVLNVCSRSVEELQEIYGEVPHGIRIASLLLVENLYNHRGTLSPTSVYQLPAFDINVKPYVRLTT